MPVLFEDESGLGPGLRLTCAAVQAVGVSPCRVPLLGVGDLDGGRR